MTVIVPVSVKLRPFTVAVMFTLYDFGVVAGDTSVTVPSKVVPVIGSLVLIVPASVNDTVVAVGRPSVFVTVTSNSPEFAVPVNVAVVPAKSGTRVSVLTGFSLRRR